MRRGTTPTYVLQFEEGTGENIVNISLTFKQRAKTLTLKMSENEIALNDDIATATLTQTQTKQFDKGSVQRQIKILFADGTVQTSDIAVETVYNLLDEDDLSAEVA